MKPTRCVSEADRVGPRGLAALLRAYFASCLLFVVGRFLRPPLLTTLYSGPAPCCAGPRSIFHYCIIFSIDEKIWYVMIRQAVLKKGMERERLTITLRKAILRLVDRSIDGAKLRNRSHAIEYYLSEALSPSKVKVVVALTPSVRPAASYQIQAARMAQEGGREGVGAIRSIFNSLLNQNFKEVLVIGPDAASTQAASIEAGHMGLSVRAAVLPGVEGDFILEQLRAQIADEPFIFWDARFSGSLDLNMLLDFHKVARGISTAALNQGGAATTGFVVQLYGHDIVDVRSTSGMEFSGLPLAGVFVFEPSVFEKAPEGKRLYQDISPVLVRTKNLKGFVFSEVRVSEPAAVTARM